MWEDDNDKTAPVDIDLYQLALFRPCKKNGQLVYKLYKLLVSALAFLENNSTQVFRRQFRNTSLKVISSVPEVVWCKYKLIVYKSSSSEPWPV